MSKDFKLGLAPKSVFFITTAEKFSTVVTLWTIKSLAGKDCPLHVTPQQSI